MLSVSKKLRDMKIKRKEGFALVAAIIACLILLAVGLVAYLMTTQDSRTSLRVMGDKKAMMATESGIHFIMANFNPNNLDGVVVNNIPANAAADPSSQYSIAQPHHLDSGSIRPLAGYAIAGGQMWGQIGYYATVTGQNTNYGGQAQVRVGFGWGPVEIDTTYR
jgi:Tfp pilus assembly protein PilX